MCTQEGLSHFITQEDDPYLLGEDIKLADELIRDLGTKVSERYEIFKLGLVKQIQEVREREREGSKLTGFLVD